MSAGDVPSTSVLEMWRREALELVPSSDKQRELIVQLVGVINALMAERRRRSKPKMPAPATTTDPDVPWERLLFVLAYSTGVLLNTHRPRRPVQVEEDQRMAAVCWELVERVKGDLGRALDPIVTWRGSVEDLATDLSAVVPREKLEELHQVLGRRLAGT